MKILKVADLTKIYGSLESNKFQALSKIDFSIDEGDFVAIMGASGSGKSTLMNIIAGYDKPTEGSVIIDNTKIESLGEKEIANFRRINLGFIFQNYQLMNSLNVKENIALPLILDKKPVGFIEEKVTDIMKYLKIDSLWDKYPHEISGGQQQRAAIGRSIINSPKVLLADEPTGNLDSYTTDNIIELFSKLNKEKNTSIIMVTHDALTTKYCNKVIFLHDGEIHNTISKKDSDNDEFIKKVVGYENILGGVKIDKK
ncbi:peptide ABC transporter ATP-binding protein [Vallitalea longa]|uniref:Peptide ABC transporter ATP-binding protein n=1 Tax=Vallitalea longa TaxID=2936439 RepID=A0A9W6DFR9_9FIRM|nr:ABC transporter ATP-binding protein [Vallitalea longa]GKX29718.1 peptide ABC transporter ATP-binding protein [Vallitalea longa]